MGTTKYFLIILLFKTCLSQNLDELFTKMNEETLKYNIIAGQITWEFSVRPDHTGPELLDLSHKIQKNQMFWQDRLCSELATRYSRQSFNSTQRRQYYLFCREPKYTMDENREKNRVIGQLVDIYSYAEICIPNDTNISMTNLTQVEAAILNYLSNFKQFYNNKPEDPILFAAKIAAYQEVEEKDMFCLNGEGDFEKMMTFSRNEEVLRWLWLAWREYVGPPMKELYKSLVALENIAARRNGYANIGASWREELEIPGLQKVCHDLHDEVKPLYRVLHGVVRFYLRRFYGDVVPERGPIPAHLLGDLWSQNWEPLANLLLPQLIDLDESIKKMNWTVMDLARKADDFYQSLGLPAMTETFWRESVFERGNNSAVLCHGTAADMYKKGDIRLLYCSDTSKEDFYVLHHELGHIQYDMAYENQPVVFRQANSAFHETVGDSIMYGVLTPQHLNRIGLINDSMLYTSNNNENNTVDKQSKNKKDNSKEKQPKNSKEFNSFLQEFKAENPKLFEDKKIEINEEDVTKDPPKLFEDNDVTIDTMLLLKHALNKIPQIPFGLVIDEYRWKYFEGSLREENQEFWRMSLELQGIAPPGFRGEEYFDIAAKFHVPDNTPYIRYFLSSFLQHQLFEKLCRASVFGRRSTEGPVPETISLTRCDIYGSKAAGKILKDFMSRGHSQHWSEILEATTGQRDISAKALKRFYEPLYVLLLKFVREHKVPLGW